MRWSWLICLLLEMMVGCAAQEKPRPLTPAVFAPSPRTQEQTPMSPLSRADQPGTLNPSRREPIPAPAPSGGNVSAIVQQNVGQSNELDLTTQPAPGSRPTTVGISSGQYLEIGGVVADVNGTPIYANKVIRRAEPALSARAKDLNEQQFRDFAKRELFGQNGTLQALVEDQLEYAAAERVLDQKDKDLADNLTIQWRLQQFRAAGGSEVVARERAAQHGDDLDELVQQQYRIWMSRIYYDKKIMPHVQVSAAEIRAYYEHNLDREFTQPASARFRLIKIDPAAAKHDDRDGARRFITELRNRIVKAGESFEAIAHSANDDARLARSGGDLGTAIQKGAFAVSAVDDAVWKTDVGKVTDVIETPSAFYIALIEEKTPQKIRPFDEAVQTEIDTRLRNELFRTQRMAHRARLLEGAAVRSNESMANIALEMAMQNYPRWRGK
jgi:parvulin-like peptidyl-prolyl isomerase